MNQVAPSLDEMINLLPLDRNYGDRSYDDVVRQLRSGELRAAPGHRIPQLFDAKTNRIVKGSGTPIMTQGVTAHQKIAAEMRNMAVDDIEMVYHNLIDKIRRTEDPRWTKIFLEFTVGKVSEARGADGMADAINKLIDMIDKRPPEVREIEYIGGEWADKK